MPVEHDFLTNFLTSSPKCFSPVCDGVPSFCSIVGGIQALTGSFTPASTFGTCSKGTRGQELRHCKISREAMATASSVVSCQVSTPGNGGEAFDSSSDQRSSPSITSPCQLIGKFSLAHLNSLTDHRKNPCQLTVRSSLIWASCYRLYVYTMHKHTVRLGDLLKRQVMQ